MTCPVCKQEIEKGSEVCPHCGAQLVPVLTEEQRKGGWRTTVTVFLVAVLLVGVFVAIILNWREVQQRTARIEYALGTSAVAAQGYAGAE